MAQTGYTPISIYYSATASNTPTAGNLVAGELALNNNDGKLFYKDSSGVVQTIATKATAALPTTTTGSGSIVLATSPSITTPALSGSTSGSVTLAVPANTLAHVYVPCTKPELILESNQPLNFSDIIQDGGVENGKRVLLVKAGQYTFSCPQ
jgi:hypothetical protein